MRLFIHKLRPEAALVIKKMWVIEETNDSVIHVRSFPVGYPFLNVIHGSKFLIEVNQGKSFFTTSYLAGQQKAPFSLNMKLVHRALTIQLQPYAIYYLLGIQSSDFTEKVISVHEFNHNLAEELEELISSDLSSENILLKSEQILMSQCQKYQIESRIIPAFQKILQSKGKFGLKQLSDFLNISQRRLQQLFKENFGLPPKTYSRIIKMQYHTYQLLKGVNIDHIVPDGYYDQSHFIHDLKNQTGLKPSEFANYINSPSKKPAYLNSNIYSL